MHRVFKIFLIFLILGFLIPGYTSCKSSKGTKRYKCSSDQAYKKRKKKKNRNNYRMKYGNKSTPTRKEYVIKNKKKR